MASAPPDGYRVTSICLPPALAQHVDTQSARLGVSKAGFLRMLIARDLEVAPARITAAQG
jgi:predicted DNA-binding protein